MLAAIAALTFIAHDALVHGIDHFIVGVSAALIGSIAGAKLKPLQKLINGE